MPRIVPPYYRYPLGSGGGGITVTEEWVANDTLQQSADTMRYRVNTGMTKVKEIELNEDVEEMRVYFELQYGTSYAAYAYGQIYLNGVPNGTLQNKYNTGWAAKSEDINNGGSGYSSGDLIQLYIEPSINGGAPPYEAEARNFRIKCVKRFVDIDGHPMTTELDTDAVLASTVNQN